MTFTFPEVAFDAWLNRFFSLGLVLILGAGLTVAKVARMATEMSYAIPFNDRPLPEAVDDLSDRFERAIIDETAFVPWPSVLPEPAAGPEPGDEQVQPAFDPRDLTEGEVVALQQLARRRKELDEREQLLDMRAELNGRVEARLDQQIAELAELKAQLEALVKGLDEAEELKLARLVKIYETMKPKAAAEIFNRLEMPVLLHVVERMKEAKSAAVLGKMDPAVAKRVTAELARKKKRPSLTGPAADNEV